MSAMRLVGVRIEVDGCAHKWTAYKTTGLVNSNCCLGLLGHETRTSRGRLRKALVRKLNFQIPHGFPCSVLCSSALLHFGSDEITIVELLTFAR